MLCLSWLARKQKWKANDLIKINYNFLAAPRISDSAVNSRRTSFALMVCHRIDCKQVGRPRALNAIITQTMLEATAVDVT